MNIPGHNQNLKPILIILAEPDHQPSTGFQASFPLLPLSTTCKPIYSIFEVLDSVIECIQPLDPWLSITAVSLSLLRVLWQLCHPLAYVLVLYPHLHQELLLSRLHSVKVYWNHWTGKNLKQRAQIYPLTTKFSHMPQISNVKAKPTGKAHDCWSSLNWSLCHYLGLILVKMMLLESRWLKHPQNIHCQAGPYDSLAGRRVIHTFDNLTVFMSSREGCKVKYCPIANFYYALQSVQLLQDCGKCIMLLLWTCVGLRCHGDILQF